jgi:hypothetical protein
MKKFMLVLAMTTTLVAISYAGGPSSQTVKEQISQYLNSISVPGHDFRDYFEIKDIIVKDRAAGEGEYTVIVSVTVRFKKSTISVFAEAFQAFANIITKPGKPGDVLTEDLTARFQLFQSGWRLKCG